MAVRFCLATPLVVLLTACSSAPPTPPQPLTGPPAADSVAVVDPGSGWTPVDPRIVRCGIDDRPRNVVSALPPRAERPPPGRDGRSATERRRAGSPAPSDADAD